jgi:CRP/FNR family transcriptional regulator, cyclic AMP receptor protein
MGLVHSTGRIAARLVELVERYGEASEGWAQITLPITREDLGGWAASSRAGVAKTLQTLRGLGWIETDVGGSNVDSLRARSM